MEQLAHSPEMDSAFIAQVLAPEQSAGELDHDPLGLDQETIDEINSVEEHWEQYDDEIRDIFPPKENGEPYTHLDALKEMPPATWFQDPETGQKREAMIYNAPQTEAGQELDPAQLPKEAYVYCLPFQATQDEYKFRILALAKRHPDKMIIVSTPPGRGGSDNLTREQVSDMMDGSLEELARSQWRAIRANPATAQLESATVMGFSEGGNEAIAMAATAHEFAFKEETQAVTDASGAVTFETRRVYDAEQYIKINAVAAESYPGSVHRSRTKLAIDTFSDVARGYPDHGLTQLRTDAIQQANHERFRHLPDFARVSLAGLVTWLQELDGNALDLADVLYGNTLAKGDAADLLIKAFDAQKELPDPDTGQKTTMKVSLGTALSDRVGPPEAVTENHHRLVEHAGSSEGIFLTIDHSTFTDSAEVDEAAIGGPGHARLRVARILVDLWEHRLGLLENPSQDELARYGV